MKTVIILLALTLLVRPVFAVEINEEAVRAFLVVWLKAQNSGSFSTYASMYAEKFHGIKRSGDRTYRYGHDAWLKDRKKMFGKKMTVSADNLRIEATERSARVTFEQTWASGSYKDKGEKELYIIMNDNKLRIAKEEMISSKLTKPTFNDFKFAFATTEGIVIENVSTNCDYTNGSPFLSTTKPHYVATKSVTTDRLPKEIQSLVGRKVRLYSSKGSCESTINGFKVISKDIPHFGFIQRWKEEKTSSPEIARFVFDEGKLHLIATTEKCSGDFATDANSREIPISTNEKIDSTLKMTVIGAFKALPLYKEDIKPFENQIESTSIQKFSLTLDGKTSTWVSMFVVAGEPYCDREGGILGSLWEIINTSKGITLKWVKYLDENPDYATDANNDGVPEFHYKDLYGTGFGFIQGKNSKVKDKFFEESAFHDCPC